MPEHVPAWGMVKVRSVLGRQVYMNVVSHGGMKDDDPWETTFIDKVMPAAV